MNEQIAMDIARNALLVATQLGAPILLATLGVGMAVSVFQAVTQINEATLSFVPKIMVVGATLAVLGPWMAQTLVGYTIEIFNFMPTLAR